MFAINSTWTRAVADISILNITEMLQKAEFEND
jgi:hypothetical protein